MSDRHLDEHGYRGLLAGTVQGEEARRLARHLEGGCDVCEAWLAQREPDALDATADLALARLFPPKISGNDLEYAKIRRRAAAQPGSRRRLVLATAAAVAVGGAALLVARTDRGHVPEPWDGMKGVETPVPARLRFSVVLPGPAGAEVERGATGAVVSSDASLLFRVEAAGPTALALLRVGADGSEVVWQGRATVGGPLDVEVGGRPAAFPLRGLAGRQRFALLAAPELGPERIEEARHRLGGAQAGASPGPAVGLDLVEVTVR